MSVDLYDSRPTRDTPWKMTLRAKWKKELKEISNTLWIHVTMETSPLEVE